MNDDVLMVARSITQAQRMQKTLAQVGIWSRIIRGPREITGLGCGYTVQLRETDLALALERLDRQGLRPNRAYLYRQGRYEEVLV